MINHFDQIIDGQVGQVELEQRLDVIPADIMLSEVDQILQRNLLS